MTVMGKPNKDGTPRRRGSYLNAEEIYYIRRHLYAGIPKQRLAERCCCDLIDIENVAKRYRKNPL